MRVSRTALGTPGPQSRSWFPHSGHPGGGAVVVVASAAIASIRPGLGFEGKATHGKQLRIARHLYPVRRTTLTMTTRGPASTEFLGGVVPGRFQSTDNDCGLSQVWTSDVPRGCPPNVLDGQRLPVSYFESSQPVEMNWGFACWAPWYAQGPLPNSQPRLTVDAWVSVMSLRPAGMRRARAAPRN